MNVSFYVEAGAQTGMGHIVRCIALADKLAGMGAVCKFFTNKLGGQIAMGAGHELTYRLDRADVWIVDLEGGCPPRLAEDLRSLSSALVILNGVGYPDGDPGRLMADLVFYQGVTDRPHRLDWGGFQGAWFEGADWVILRDGIIRRWRETHHTIPRIVVVGGGADIGGVSRRVVEALDCHRYDVRVIVGPASRDVGKWPASVQVVRSPDNFFEHLDWADVAVVSYGMTAFECLASGLPTVALSITLDHEASADRVQREGRYALLSLGMVNEVVGKKIQAAVEFALVSIIQWSGTALEFVDGQGAARVSQIIMEVAGG